MTATDELRAELTRRGVEWNAPSDSETWWETEGNNHWSAEENGDGKYLTFEAITCVTPAQAIAATLGRGECHMRETTLPFVSDGNNDGYYMICSECGFAIYMRRIWAPLKYCSNCGRKVVDA